jgi:hypothetical protein
MSWRKKRKSSESTEAHKKQKIDIAKESARLDLDRRKMSRVAELKLISQSKQSQSSSDEDESSVDNEFEYSPSDNNRSEYFRSPKKKIDSLPPFELKERLELGPFSRQIGENETEPNVFKIKTSRDKITPGLKPFSLPNTNSNPKPTILSTPITQIMKPNFPNAISAVDLPLPSSSQSPKFISRDYELFQEEPEPWIVYISAHYNHLVVCLLAVAFAWMLYNEYGDRSLSFMTPLKAEVVVGNLVSFVINLSKGLLICVGVFILGYGLLMYSKRKKERLLKFVIFNSIYIPFPLMIPLFLLGRGS